MRERLAAARWLLAAAALLALIAPLAWMMQESVRQMIVEPIAYALWTSDLMIKSLPQWQLWVGMVLAALAGGIWILAGGVKVSWPEPRPERQPGRVADWAELLRISSRAPFFRRHLAAHLGRLVVEAVAHREQLTASEARARLRHGELPLRPDLQRFLRIDHDLAVASQPSPSPDRSARSERRAQALRPYTRPSNFASLRAPSHLRAPTPDLRPVEEIADFLEDYLE